MFCMLPRWASGTGGGGWAEGKGGLERFGVDRFELMRGGSVASMRLALGVTPFSFSPESADPLRRADADHVMPMMDRLRP